MLFVASCSKDDRTDNTNPAGGGQPTLAKISFAYDKPTLTRGATVASDAENAIYDIDVYMFLADGAFARHLTPADYTTAPADEGRATELTLTDNLLADYAGRQVFFYFVANNVASTGGPHITGFSGADEAEFRELLCNPAPLSTKPWDTDKSAPIVVDAAQRIGLLMTGRSQTILLSGERTETVRLKRRVARFDVYNLHKTENVLINTYYVSNAATCAPLFGTSAVASVPTYKSIGLINDRPTNFDAEGYHNGAFYLYPTTLEYLESEGDVPSPDKTSITINAQYKNVKKLFSVNSNIDIEANKRYIIKFDGSSFGLEGGTGDWEEGGSN